MVSLETIEELSIQFFQKRKNNEIKTSGDLKRILEPLSNKSEKNKFLAKVFQAIRIEVNDEINIIKSLLLQSSKILKKGGKFVYHITL